MSHNYFDIASTIWWARLQWLQHSLWSLSCTLFSLQDSRLSCYSAKEWHHSILWNHGKVFPIFATDMHYWLFGLWCGWRSNQQSNGLKPRMFLWFNCTNVEVRGRGRSPRWRWNELHRQPPQTFGLVISDSFLHLLIFHAVVANATVTFYFKFSMPWKRHNIYDACNPTVQNGQAPLHRSAKAPCATVASIGWYQTAATKAALTCRTHRKPQM